MSHVSPQNNYADVNVRIPRYRYARIPLNNLSGGVVPLNPTSTTLLEWKLPASSVYNMSRSFVSYQYTVPALAANENVIFEDGCDFRTCFFGNGSGLGIVDLQFSDAYVNTIRPIKTRLQNFLQNDQLQQFYPCNSLASVNTLPFSKDGLAAGTAQASTTSYLEPQHLLIGGAAAATPVSRYFPLSSFKDTFLDMDKDVVFGTDMYLRLFTNYLQRMAYQTTTAGGNVPLAGNTNDTALSAVINASNVYLYLAIEENLEIRASLLGALASGQIKMSIPYTYAYRFSSAAGAAAANISLTLTKNYGRAIKRLLFVPYNGLENSRYAYDHSNFQGSKITQLTSTMDGRPLIDYPINCYNPNSTLVPAGVIQPVGQSFADDWREARKNLEGSVLCSYNQYSTNWFYADTWGQSLPTEGQFAAHMAENVNDGFDLLNSGDHIYSISALTPGTGNVASNTNAAGLINYLFVLFNRTLVIQADGISMMS